MLDFSQANETGFSTDIAQHRSAAQAVIKDAMDRGAALILLVLLSPALVLIALAVTLDSRGPVLFCQPRGGRDGSVFNIYKFRTMSPRSCDAQATRNDPRVTRVGAFLRRTSLDELPQLLNILKGEMSFVGPRPHAVSHDRYYAPRVPHYMLRYAVKPGLTGWAQINRARGETETVEKMARRTQLDLHYILNWSVWLDLKILAQTPMTLLTSDQAY